MPYKIVKFKKGYKVAKKYPPKYFSKKYMTLKNAKKQFEILKKYEEMKSKQKLKKINK